MNLKRVIQYIEPCKHEQEAIECLAGLKLQSCYLGGRLLPPVNQIDKDMWRVQTFHEADGVSTTDLLPDGCRLVFMPEGLGNQLGIKGTS